MPPPRWAGCPWVQQVLALAHLDRAPLVVYIGLALAWAGVFAAMSWRGVAEPAMQLRSARREGGRWLSGGRATFTASDRWWLLRAAGIGAVVSMVATLAAHVVWV